MEFELLQHLLSYLEYRGPRLAVHVHLQGHVRDRDTGKQELVSLHGVRDFSDLPRVPPVLDVPVLLSGVDATLRWSGTHYVVPTKIGRERLHMVLLELGQWSISQFVLHGIFRESKLSSYSRRYL